MAIEDVYDDIGGLGAFQIIIVVWLFGLKAMVGFSIMQMAFAGFGPNFSCLLNDEDNDATHQTPMTHLNSSMTTTLAMNGFNDSTSLFGNGTDILNVCSVNGTSCTSYAYDGVKRTIVTEFDLVCDQKWMRSGITSLQMVGVLIGATITGHLGDMVGRKGTNYGFLLGEALTNLIGMFSTSLPMFILLSFLSGVCSGAMLVILSPYTSEFLPKQWRYLITVVPSWPIGVLGFAFCAYLFEDWRYLHLCSAIFHIPGLLGFFYIPESVRWLAIQGRTEEAYSAVKKMARCNRKPVPSYTKQMLENIARAEKKNTLEGKAKTYSYLDIVKTGDMLKLTLIFAFHWASLSTVFYGLTFGVASLSGNLYVNMGLMTIVEVPAYLLNLCITQRLGRRFACSAFFGLAAVASAGCVIVHLSDPDSIKTVLITALCMSAKLCCGACWAASQAWVAESYPTVTRSLGYASANIAARVGGIMAPFIVNPGDYPFLTYSIMAMMMFLSFILTLLVPETKDALLHETYGDEVVVVGDAADTVKDLKQNQYVGIPDSNFNVQDQVIVLNGNDNKEDDDESGLAVSLL